MRLKTVILLACLCVLTVGAQLASAQLGPAIGNITTAGATCSTTSPSTNCVTLKLDGSTGAATILITNTFVGTAQFEVSNDGLSTWTNINCTPPNSTTAASSATSTGSWQCNVAGWEHIRVRASAYTSGTISVVINGAHASAKSGGGAVYASGLGTNNVIPKGNGAGQLADSALTDNATTITSTEPILFPDGAVGAPSISFTNNATWGLWRDASGIEASMNGVNYWRWTSAGEFHVNGNASGTTAGFYIDNGLGTNIAQISRNAGTGGLQMVQNSAAPLTISLGASGTGLNIFYGAGASAVTIGNVPAAAPAARTIQLGESSRSGTDTDTAGGSGSIRPGDGTGTGAAAKVCIQRNLMRATSSTAQSQIDGYCVGPSKTLSNTSATAQSLVNISVPSNSAGGVEGTITITCTDGTNFDAETQSFNTSFVNKATVLTVTAPVITTTTAANNSGSCTAGITAVAGTNSVDIKVTPVFTTIVPTTVTSYIALRNNGTGNATFN